MIRPSDKGPGRPRPPRVKTPRPPKAPSGGGGKKGGCPLFLLQLLAVPAMTILAACTLLTHGGH